MEIHVAAVIVTQTGLVFVAVHIVEAVVCFGLVSFLLGLVGLH